MLLLDLYFNHHEYDSMTEEEFEKILEEKVIGIYGTTGEGVSYIKEFQLGKETKAEDYVPDPNNPGYVTPGFVDVQPLPWVTVHAAKGSTAQTAAEAAGIKFEAFENSEPTVSESDSPTEEAKQAEENKTGIAAFFQRIADFFRDFINSIKRFFRF